MKSFKRIGVLTSGGDAPGMNAAARAVVRTALAKGVEVMGIYRGYSGLIEGEIKPLTLRDVSNTLNKGGTNLFSDRCLEMLSHEGKLQAVETCKKFGIEGIVAIGGDGTFRGARALTEYGIPCVGIPATIDNDITSTDNTIGFDTAMNTVIDLVDKLRDTCESHARCNVVEVMGRGAGDIALYTSISAGATAVVIPELPYSDEEICAKIAKGKALGKRNFIVIVSEGVGSEFAPALAKKIQKDTGVETKFARLAHIVRGGAPTQRDRMLASRLGAFAVYQLLEGRSNIVICEKKDEIVYSDINFALTLDGMYKKNISKEEALRDYSAEEVAQMEAAIAEREAYVRELYDLSTLINI